MGDLPNPPLLISLEKHALSALIDTKAALSVLRPTTISSTCLGVLKQFQEWESLMKCKGFLSLNLLTFV